MLLASYATPSTIVAGGMLISDWDILLEKICVLMDCENPWEVWMKDVTAEGRLLIYDQNSFDLQIKIKN